MAITVSRSRYSTCLTPTQNSRNCAGGWPSKELCWPLKRHNDKEAAANLAIVSADKSIDTYLRRRAAYLAGQILQTGGNYQQAAGQFALVTDLNPKIDMDFIAPQSCLCVDASGGVQNEAIASLKSMLIGDDKFSPYFEQIYYVLGRLSANGGNNSEAVAYLQSGIASAKTTRKGKALSFAAIGNIYFNIGAYAEAKVAFDSVSRFAVAAQDDSGVALAMRRAPLVDKIALPGLHRSLTGQLAGTRGPQ